ncbi:ABC transporter ATP-binding protein [Aerococcus christensenii]|uniref:ABC transporter, ATP-binding protein n=1 Tax=Aerococcus christensenii TaxID=87541 RepID=A0A133XZM3_9LACT|nr:ABC transporter ATP-binding protein [Aerococcus christensenii]KXB36381.1 ABC transporter, ATP-binding protein [Aerococcus christensenii]MDK8234613.1 ABC transporter ATP-binding protein [Aerococcus christensenii]WEB70449.1 ABC transporter ATP-binding protein [Aerococcus christensenii]
MHVWPIILKNWRKEILAFFAKVGEAVLELMVPYVMADIINQGIHAGDAHYVLTHGLLLILFPIMGYLCALVCQWYASLTMQTVGTTIRHALYQKICQLDLEQIDHQGPQAIVTRVTNDSHNVQEAVAKSLRLASRSPVIVLGAMGMAYWMSPTLSPIFILGGIALAFVFSGITINSNRRFARIQDQLDRLSGQVRENLTGIRVIRAFVNHKREIDRFKKANDHLFKQQIKVGQVQALATPMSLMVVNICIGLIIYFGATLVDNGFFRQGEVIALIAYMNSIFLALSVLVKLLVIMSRGFASAKRLDAFLDLPDKEEVAGLSFDESMPTSGAHVDFKQVTFAYGKHPILKAIDLTMESGQWIGVIGGTGAGKTILVNLLMGFYPVTEGEITLDGQPYASLPLDKIRQQIALVPQKAVLLTGTIRSNLLMANPKASDEDLWQALECAQAADFVREKEAGLDSFVDQGGMNFSGGQRQRLTIARALLNPSRLLILDDSLSALDFATERRIRENLKSLPKTLLVISQRISSIRYADKILVLDHGEMVGFANHQELLDQCETYRAIYYSQYPEEATKDDK